MRNWLFMLFNRLLPLLVCATPVFSQSNPSPARETFQYGIDWRLFSAGKARVELNTAPQPEVTKRQDGQRVLGADQSCHSSNIAKTPTRSDQRNIRAHRGSPRVD